MPDQDFETRVREALLAFFDATGYGPKLTAESLAVELAPRVAAAIRAAIAGEDTRLTRHGGHQSDVEDAALAALRGGHP